MTYLWIIIAIIVVAAIGLTFYLVPRRARSRGAAASPPILARRSRNPARRPGPARVVDTLAPPPGDAAPPSPVEAPAVAGPSRSRS